MSPDLNGLLGAIVACDQALKDADEMLRMAQADRDTAAQRLADAQHTFDSAVAAARGAVAPQPAAGGAGLPTQATTPTGQMAPAGYHWVDGELLPIRPVQMGPLPPTSPAVRGQDMDTDDDMRPDNVEESEK